jgi:hypothetical protein
MGKRAVLTTERSVLIGINFLQLFSTTKSTIFPYYGADPSVDAVLATHSLKRIRGRI